MTTQVVQQALSTVGRQQKAAAMQTQETAQSFWTSRKVELLVGIVTSALGAIGLATSLVLWPIAAATLALGSSVFFHGYFFNKSDEEFSLTQDVEHLKELSVDEQKNLLASAPQRVQHPAPNVTWQPSELIDRVYQQKFSNQPFDAAKTPYLETGVYKILYDAATLDVDAFNSDFTHFRNLYPNNAPALAKGVLDVIEHLPADTLSRMDTYRLDQIKRYAEKYVPEEEPVKPFVPSTPATLPKPAGSTHEEAQKPEGTSKKSELTSADKVLAASNAVQWGLIGAACYGVSASVTAPIAVAATVGSTVANYCMLPEHASIVRKAMTLSMPIVTQKVVGLNPVLKVASHAHSLYTLAKSSAPKLKGAWEELKTDPKNAVKNGAVHLFNLASGATFAAESLGLINLRPTQAKEEASQEEKPEAQKSQPTAEPKLSERPTQEPKSTAAPQQQQSKPLTAAEAWKAFHPKTEGTTKWSQSVQPKPQTQGSQPATAVPQRSPVNPYFEKYVAPKKLSQTLRDPSLPTCPAIPSSKNPEFGPANTTLTVPDGIISGKTQGQDPILRELHQRQVEQQQLAQEAQGKQLMPMPQQELLSSPVRLVSAADDKTCPSGAEPFSQALTEVRQPLAPKTLTVRIPEERVPEALLNGGKQNDPILRDLYERELQQYQQAQEVQGKQLMSMPEQELPSSPVRPMSVAIDGTCPSGIKPFSQALREVRQPPAPKILTVQIPEERVPEAVLNGGKQNDPILKHLHEREIQQYQQAQEVQGKQLMSMPEQELPSSPVRPMSVAIDGTCPSGIKPFSQALTEVRQPPAPKTLTVRIPEERVPEALLNGGKQNDPILRHLYERELQQQAAAGKQVGHVLPNLASQYGTCPLPPMSTAVATVRQPQTLAQEFCSVTVPKTEVPEAVLNGGKQNDPILRDLYEREIQQYQQAQETQGKQLMSMPEQELPTSPVRLMGASVDETCPSGIKPFSKALTEVRQPLAPKTLTVRIPEERVPEAVLNGGKQNDPILRELHQRQVEQQRLAQEAQGKQLMSMPEQELPSSPVRPMSAAVDGTCPSGVEPFSQALREVRQPPAPKILTVQIPEERVPEAVLNGGKQNDPILKHLHEREIQQYQQAQEVQGKQLMSMPEQELPSSPVRPMSVAIDGTCPSGIKPFSQALTEVRQPPAPKTLTVRIPEERVPEALLNGGKQNDPILRHLYERELQQQAAAGKQVGHVLPNLASQYGTCPLPPMSTAVATVRQPQTLAQEFCSVTVPKTEVPEAVLNGGKQNDPILRDLYEREIQQYQQAQETQGKQLMSMPEQELPTSPVRLMGASVDETCPSGIKPFSKALTEVRQPLAPKTLTVRIPEERVPEAVLNGGKQNDPILRELHQRQVEQRRLAQGAAGKQVGHVLPKYYKDSKGNVYQQVGEGPFSVKVPVKGVKVQPQCPAPIFGQSVHEDEPTVNFTSAPIAKPQSTQTTPPPPIVHEKIIEEPTPPKDATLTEGVDSQPNLRSEDQVVEEVHEKPAPPKGRKLTEAEAKDCQPGWSLSSFWSAPTGHEKRKAIQKQCVCEKKTWDKKYEGVWTDETDRHARNPYDCDPEKLFPGSN